MQLIAGSSNYPLAKKISQAGNIPLLDVKISRFNDGELQIKLSSPVARNIFILQSLQQPTGEYLLELLLLADAAKRNGARNIVAIIPYLAYSRQDRVTANNDALSAKLLLNILEKSAIDKLFTLDIHSNYLARIANIPFINITSTKVFLPLLADKKSIEQEDIILVTPDIGGAQRLEHYRHYLANINRQKLKKIRQKDGQCRLISENITILAKNYFIIDDIIDSGNSLCSAAKLLKRNGAKSVKALVTHGVLSPGALNRLEKIAELEHIYLTDSIPQTNLPNKFTVLSAAETIAKALHTILRF